MGNDVSTRMPISNTHLEGNKMGLGKQVEKKVKELGKIMGLGPPLGSVWNPDSGIAWNKKVQARIKKLERRHHGELCLEAD